MAPQVLEGTWEEIVRHGEQLSGKRVRLTVLPDHEPASLPAAPLYLTGTSEEVIAALDAIAERNRHRPVLPPEAFTRESLYADDDEICG